MAMAVALVAIVAASLLFHFVSPWHATPLASNWQAMDDTLLITFVITGVFFVAINLFIVFAILRFRHRPGARRRARGEADDSRLERWLIVGTTVGIVALLAPGLAVYAEYIRPPADAMTVEALSQQWQWRFRFPGDSGRLGGSDVRFVAPDNPFGVDPADPEAHDDRLVVSHELHLPLGRPVRMLLRSHDVLHDFYVPQFRARMNIVPGMVTSFWFTPTEAGRYEILCAQLCGIGHFNMRGVVVVEEPAAFDAWLREQPTFAAATATAGGESASDAGAASADADSAPARGKAIAQAKGCLGCHSVDGSRIIGPSWKGLYGGRTELADGSAARVDDDYLRRSIAEPNAQIVKGYPPLMPPSELTEDETEALLAYLRSLGGGDGKH